MCLLTPTLARVSAPIVVVQNWTRLLTLLTPMSSYNAELKMFSVCKPSSRTRYTA